MTDLLTQNIVLVLNRNWQAINIRTPQDAFCQMATNVATALDIEGESHIRPVKWDEWITLPVREGDYAVRTARGAIRVPTVVVAVNFARVPKKRPKLSARTIRERDGNRCQYTGKLLQPDEGSLDHVLPRSRGGADTWENLVWSSKDVNTRKGNRLPHEAGLKLLSVPRAPKELPASAMIRNAHGVAPLREVAHLADERGERHARPVGALAPPGDGPLRGLLELPRGERLHQVVHGAEPHRPLDRVERRVGRDHHDLDAGVDRLHALDGDPACFCHSWRLPSHRFR